MNSLLRNLLLTAALTATVTAGAFAQATSADKDLNAAIAAADGEAVAEGAEPEGTARAGVLSCTIEGGIGLLVGSSKGVTCTFEGVNGTETYAGRINKLGLDIGYTGEQYLSWAVFTAEGADASSALAGDYAGVSAGANLGVGFGANALVGGDDSKIVLQPVSVQAGTGLNVAVGVSSLRLDRV